MLAIGGADMPPVTRARRAGLPAAAAALAGLLVLAGCGSGHDTGAPAPSSPPGSPAAESSRASRPPSAAGTAPGGVELPPLHAGFDYQIGGAYPPAKDVRVVSRDRSARPAPGLYNICYVNAFQAQPDERDGWPADLLLRDRNGRVVVDRDWDEPLLDIGTPEKRERVAARVGPWIDGCADHGFDAVEPDNYDSYTRSKAC